MTLKDIAKEAGVSISTVSRVINNKACNAASKDTQDKIWSIVRKTGYTPNPAAQTLKKGNALVNSDKPTRFIDCLQARSTNIDADPFFFELERAIEQEAFNHNCIVKRSFAPADIRDMKEITSLQGNLADGVVILGRFGFSQAQMKLAWPACRSGKAGSGTDYFKFNILFWKAGADPGGSFRSIRRACLWNRKIFLVCSALVKRYLCSVWQML